MNPRSAAAAITATPTQTKASELLPKSTMTPAMNGENAPRDDTQGEFGVRSEIDLFMGDNGPHITTRAQRDVALIDA